MTRRQAGKSGGGKAPTRGSSGRSYRGDAGLTRQPKKMRGRKPSSQRWLTRQLNDPFVAEAKSRGFRSRAALKLEQMDDRFKLLLAADRGGPLQAWQQRRKTCRD
jgi:23S rRNA (uridine2552-2'-O)-methyltransferase